eukprot:scaffold121953_cov24-Tisochrysis_lutea.AAC.1
MRGAQAEAEANAREAQRLKGRHRRPARWPATEPEQLRPADGHLEPDGGLCEGGGDGVLKNGKVDKPLLVGHLREPEQVGHLDEKRVHQLVDALGRDERPARACNLVHGDEPRGGDNTPRDGEDEPRLAPHRGLELGDDSWPEPYDSLSQLPPAPLEPLLLGEEREARVVVKVEQPRD